MTSSFPTGNTKPTTWSIPAPVTNDGNDVTKSGHEEESFSSIKKPLLGGHDHRNQKKTWGKIVFTLLALLAVTCLVLTSNRVSLEHTKLHGKVKTYGSDTVESDKGVVASDDPRCSEVGVSMLKGFELIGTRDLQSDLPDIVKSEQGVVVADDARCSEVGAQILRDNGNAVDAAVATTLCLGVVNPTESGIGGGAFMVVYNTTTNETVAFNMREKAPLAAHESMYENDIDAMVKGPLSMAVPGELAGLYEAWKLYGRLEWETLLQPAIQYAKNGFLVFPYLTKYIQAFENEILADPGKREVFAPNGKILTVGELCFNKKLATTLEAIAEEGPQVFYNGSVGEKLVNDVRSRGGILKMEDLRTYDVHRPNVVDVDIMGYKILGMPPPSSGTVGLAMVAKILENYESYDELKGSLGLHRLVEAMKYMLAMRMNLGDPDFDDVADYVYNMTSSSFATEIWRKIDDYRTFFPEHYVNRWSQTHGHGTSHVGVVDAERNAVSITASINDHFGGKFMSPTTGIMINNQMSDFATPTPKNSDHLPQATANLIAPGKRPLSSMTPLIILKDGQLAGVIGGSGGMNIIAAVTQVFLHHFVQHEDPLAAIQNPRIYPKLKEKILDYENLTVINGKHIELQEENRLFLAGRGHQMEEIIFPAVCHLIVQSIGKSIDLGRKNGRNSVGNERIGTLTAVTDLRKDAKPAAV